MGQNAVARYRDDLVHLVGSAIDWLADVADLASRVDTLEVANLVAMRKDLAAFRLRAQSALLTVAVLGEFSSGKSFLISGLQGRLVDEAIRHEGEMRHQYRGVLPSTPRPTTTCPARLVCDPELPSDVVELRVQFVGESTWERREVDRDGRSVIAYATELEQWMNYRSVDDRSRAVAEIQVVIGEGLLSVDFFDLPGSNAPERVHEAIAAERMRDADAFLYVSNATATLNESALRHLRTLHAHHSATSKPVIWVLTAVDRADDIGLDGRPSWEMTLEENNRFLAQYFTRPDGKVDSEFIGQGFAPVSPAKEAQGRQLCRTNAEAGARMVADSRMPDLRHTLQALIDGQQGRDKLIRIASEVGAILRSVGNAVGDWRDVERAPIDDLAAALANTQAELHRYRVAKDAFVAQMDGMIAETVGAAMRGFSSKALRGLIREHVHAVIDRVNPARDSDVHEIEMALARTVKSWISAPGGPSATWSAAEGKLVESLLGGVAAVLPDVAGLGLGSRSSFEVSTDSHVSISTARRELDMVGPMTPGDVLNVAGGLSSVAGLVALGFGVTGPVGWLTLGAVLVVGGAVSAVGGVRKNRSSTRVLRTELKASVDRTPESLKVEFEREVRDRLAQVRLQVTSKLEAEAGALMTVERRLASRLESGDLITHRDLLDEAARLLEARARLIVRFDELVRSLP